MGLRELRQKIERAKGKQEQVVKDIFVTENNIKSLKREILYSEKAQLIITAVAKTTQEELQYRITEPVSLSLASVYDNPYTMVSDFKIAGRGTTECYLKFERDGNQTKPLDASGGGPVNVAALALQVGALSLKRPKPRPVLILDEPGTFVERDKKILFGQMIKETSKQLGLQVLLISHIDELIETSDKIIEVKKVNGVSQVNEISEIKKGE